jgi:hypothetical protein
MGCAPVFNFKYQKKEQNMKTVNVKATDVEFAYTGAGFTPVRGPAVVHYAAYGEMALQVQNWREKIQNDPELSADYAAKMAKFQGNKGEKLHYEARYLNDKIGNIDHLFVEGQEPSYTRTMSDIVKGKNLLTIAKNVIAANTYK